MQQISSLLVRRRVWCTGMALALTLGWAAAARAQTDRNKSVDDLLKSLIEAELNKMDNQEKKVRPSDVPASALPVQDPRQLNRELTDFSQDALELSLSLYNDVNRIPGVRPLLYDVYDLRARSSALSKKTASGNEWKTLISEIESIGSDWQVTSFKLIQVPNLSKTQTQLIAKMDASAKSLASLLKTSPQVNYFELVRTTSAMDADFSNLLDDIQLELGNTDATRSLLIDGGKAQQQIQHISLMARDKAGRQSIVDEYKRFDEMWNPLMVRLQQSDNRYIERDVRRIGESSRTMREMLLLPNQLDRQKLMHVTSLLKKDVDEFFSRTPLKLLLGLPNSQYVLSTADEFYGVCQNFTDLVERNQPTSDLVDAFGYIAESEKSFRELFSPIHSQAAVTVLTSIDRHVDELRDSLSLNESFDRDKAVQLAASLENLTEHLQLDTQLWLNRQQTGFKEKALAATAKFAREAADFHRNMLADESLTQLRTESDAMYETWREVYSYISLSQDEDRIHLAQLAGEIGPALVEIRTLIQQ